MEPQSRQRGEDEHIRLSYHSQRVHWANSVRRGRSHVTVLQPKRKRNRGSLTLASEKRTIHIVSEELGDASISRDGVTEIGELPAAVVRASDTASTVTSLSTYFRLSSIVP